MVFTVRLQDGVTGGQIIFSGNGNLDSKDAVFAHTDIKQLEGMKPWYCLSHLF